MVLEVARAHAVTEAGLIPNRTFLILTKNAPNATEADVSAPVATELAGSYRAFRSDAWNDMTQQQLFAIALIYV